MHTDTNLLQRILNQFKFTRLEVLFLILSSLVLVVYSFFMLIRETSRQISDFEKFFESEIVTRTQDAIQYVVDTVATADVATMALWAIVGAVVYILFWAAYSVFYGANTTLRSAFTYVHPKDFTSSNFLIQSIVERLLFLGLLFCAIFYGSILLSVIIPYVFDEVVRVMEQTSSESFLALLYLFGLSISLHMLIGLIRVIRGKYRLQ